MSLEARNWARRIGGLSIAAKAVLMALADHADAEGKAWPKLQTLAEITSMTERHVRRQIGVLEGRGWSCAKTASARTAARRATSTAWPLSARLPQVRPRRTCRARGGGLWSPTKEPHLNLPLLTKRRARTRPSRMPVRRSTRSSKPGRQ